MSRLRLVLATANAHKVAEIAELLPGVELVPRPDEVGEVVEDAGTLVGNARLKAVAICDATGEAAVADDTGLEVDALGGLPGVESAYYAGPEHDSDKNVDKLLAEMKACKAHICTPEETAKVRKLLFTDTGFNGAVIGKDAGWIAREAGFSANGAKILVTPVDLVQPEEKLVREKLCPVLAFARVGGIDQAVSCARSMMRKTGRGHSAAAHSNDENNILAFAAAVPALRIAVNAGCSLGASGFETNLGPSMTIGTGFAGGSSIGDNLTPHHFVQFARIAYNKEASVSFGAFEGRDPLNLPRAAAGPVVQPQLQLHSGGLDADAMRQELRKIILEELNAVLAA